MKSKERLEFERLERLKQEQMRNQLNIAKQVHQLKMEQYFSKLEELKSIESDKFEFECPASTQNVELNLGNRQKAIDKAHYGPLNPNEPNDEYWKKKADMFEGDVASAKKALCGNCAFFIQTKNMLDCIAGGINDTNEWDTIEAGDLGYCEAFDFKCAASRTCDAWVVGGPITD